MSLRSFSPASTSLRRCADGHAEPGRPCRLGSGPDTGVRQTVGLSSTKQPTAVAPHCTHLTTALPRPLRTVPATLVSLLFFFYLSSNYSDCQFWGTLSSRKIRMWSAGVSIHDYKTA